MAQGITIGRSTLVIILIVILVLAGVFYFVSLEQKPSPLSSFGVEKLEISDQTSKQTLYEGFVYVASTSSEQTQGFMGVTNFGSCNGFASANEQCIGMIFIVPSTQEICLWMHDTLLSLEQVWISQNGTVTAIYQAQPETDKTVCNSSMFVLETNPAMQISIGDTINQTNI